MTTVRVFLAVLFVLAASVAQAVPAPLPKPDRRPLTEAQLLRELQRMGFEVVRVDASSTPGWWVVQIAHTERLSDGPIFKRRVSEQVPGKDRLSVLRAIYESKVFKFRPR
jgi:hypothetical protein